MGKSKWFFSMSGLILLICALAIAGKGINFGIDFESRHADHRGARAGRRRVDEVRNALAPHGLRATRRSRRSTTRSSASNVVQISTEGARPERGRRGQTTRSTSDFGVGDNPTSSRSARRFGRDGRQLGADRDHRLAARDLDLHRAALRVEVRRAGADRADARHPDHGGRLRPRRPGGDDVDGRGAAHHLGLLALRHDHRVRPDPRERPADAERGVLADRQPLDVARSSSARWRRASARCCRCSRCCSSAARRCKDFAFALLIGIASGTYSSIFIATPVLDALEGARAGLPRRAARGSSATLGDVPAYATATQGGPVDVAPEGAARRPPQRSRAPAGSERRSRASRVRRDGPRPRRRARPSASRASPRRAARPAPTRRPAGAGPRRGTGASAAAGRRSEPRADDGDATSEPHEAAEAAQPRHGRPR